MTSVMAFQLIVYTLGIKQNTDGMYFRDVHRCRYFASALDRRSPNVAAWCIPVMTSEKTKFWD